MQKFGVEIVLLVIGMIIGLSVGIYISIYPPPRVEEPIKVTIQGIEYTTSVHSILKIDLLNNVPEKNLEGFIIVFQNNKQWTSEVTWYYTGYGETEIICDSINETENFRVVYMENSTKVTAFYLDRIIEWNEVNRTFPFMNTEQLQITQVTFDIVNDNLIISVQNTGTVDVTIISVTVTGNGVTSTDALADNVIFDVDGTTTSMVIDIQGSMVAGSPYNIELLSSKGNKFSYTTIA